jgi:hypothetical protein
VAEQPMLDLIPLRGAGRIVVDVYDETALVSQFLQFDLPQPHSRAVRLSDLMFCGMASLAISSALWMTAREHDRCPRRCCPRGRRAKFQSKKF